MQRWAEYLELLKSAETLVESVADSKAAAGSE